MVNAAIIFRFWLICFCNARCSKIVISVNESFLILSNFRWYRHVNIIQQRSSSNNIYFIWTKLSILHMIATLDGFIIVITLLSRKINVFLSFCYTSFWSLTQLWSKQSKQIFTGEMRTVKILFRLVRIFRS